MGGQIDWAAMPIMVELYDIQDPEIFIGELVAIREHLALQARA